MILIKTSENIKEQFEKEGLAYPYKKSSGKYGIRGSTLLDDNTLQGAEQKILNYLETKNRIKVVIQ
jgi:hypothetical protein